MRAKKRKRTGLLGVGPGFETSGYHLLPFQSPTAIWRILYSFFVVNICINNKWKFKFFCKIKYISITYKIYETNTL